MAYPTDLQDLNAGIGASGDKLSSPNHIDQHTSEVAVIEALEAKVGANSSAVTTSHDYKLSGVTGSDKAVSLTGTEDLTNKSLKTGTKITLGSDATGDIYYRHSDGTLKRLPVSTDGKILKLASGVPAWDTEVTVADASTTAKGIAEEATLAQIDANTGAGETSARLFVNPSTLGKSTDGTMADNSDAKVPSQKAVKTYVDTLGYLTFSNGNTTKNTADDSTTQNIAHGLSRVPKKIKIIAIYQIDSTQQGYRSETVYNGTTQSSLSRYYTVTTATTDATFTLAGDPVGGGKQVGVVTFDATNIIITWTKTNSPTGVYQLMWEAQ